MAVNGRNKGAKAERVASKLISKWTGKGFSKTPASGGLGWKKANVAGDIVCTTEGHYCPFCFEVKSYKKIDFSELLNPKIKNIDITKYWQQCLRDSEKVNKIPMLMMRQNGLSKDFYFVAISLKFYIHIKDLLPKGITILKYIANSKSNKLVIFRSNELFNSNYLQIKKSAKKFINESTRK